MTTSFQADIRPLFAERDIHGTSKAFNLERGRLSTTAFAELAAPLRHHRRREAKVPGRSLTSICSVNG